MAVSLVESSGVLSAVRTVVKTTVRTAEAMAHGKDDKWPLRKETVMAFQMA